VLALSFVQQNLAIESVTPQQVITAFTEKAGIRATILNSGIIIIDMPIEITQ
jgi:hypothetical protein